MHYKNSFLKLYMDYVEETESPRTFHLWSAISGIGACLGRRAFLPWGTDVLYPNQYILLVGPPATRKNTAINIVKRIIGNATSTKFAPDDTGGQYQGLLTAMSGDVVSEDQELAAIIEEANSAVNIQDSKVQRLMDYKVRLDARDAHVMYAIATEFSTVMGEKSAKLTRFLIKIYDGEDYRYRLKNSNTVLSDPLLSILGGTTPTEIVETLPESAIGGGFTSRMVLVHGTKKHKMLHRPKELDQAKRQQIEDIYRTLFYDFDGPFQVTVQADIAIKNLYEYSPEMNDSRFIYYAARRQIHLLKLSMCLAAGRMSKVIEASDIEEAHEILKVTEQSMVDAFGEYGLSPLSAAKQKLIEFLQNCNGPVPKTTLWFVMQKDMKLVDFENTMMDLERAHKIFVKHHTEFGPICVYRDEVTEVLMDTTEQEVTDDVLIERSE